ncbi:serine/threonine-protein kinase [Alcaligenaceae bacterium A4P071]|nr:serine/threonine-protein kinase [Alcaligenaceae bacterium A4P071]
MSRPQPPTRYKATSRASSAGGYGVVEVWHDNMLNREVAIKWLISHDGEDQLLNEWRVLANAVSRHVVEIYDLVFDRHGALFGIVMEYVAGGTLMDVPVPDDEQQQIQAFHLLYQLALGLTDLHKNAIVHRDVKPENTVISVDGRLKICDFGLATPAGETSLQARATMGYCAPEFFSRPVPISLKSDVYSFGAVCWKVLVGELPKIGRHGIPEASHFPIEGIGGRTTLPIRLADLIDRCMSWKPDDRPEISEAVLTLRNELTRGRHRASVLLSGGPATIDVGTPRKKLSAGANSIQVEYDGYDFSIAAVGGDVFINNSAAVVGHRLTEGCLLTFGNASLAAGRAFAPFRQFVPELVI